MADQDPRRGASIPEWQKTTHQPSPSSEESASSSSDQPSSSGQTTGADAANNLTSELSLLEQARKFLDDDAIREAPRERKVAFLQKKGLSADHIDTLLGSADEQTSSHSEPEFPSEIKTVHDSNSNTNIDSSNKAETQSQTTSDPETPPATLSISEEPSAAVSVSNNSNKREIPPIITYPEFLLKPQKPPPLVTIDRLINAAYIFTGISALTYGASKYIVQPMLETLTEARHELAETALSDLDVLNKKLESTVSHVPYFPSSTVLQKQTNVDNIDNNDDIESIDSDPTELFHRDIATQTSPPPLLRSNSLSSETQGRTAQDPTAAQASRLQSLHGTLSSLLHSTTTHFSQDRLKDQVSQLQMVLDKLETSYNPFAIDYYGTPSSSSFGTYSFQQDDKSKQQQSKKPDAEAQKFKSEIRSLKGALLSSRNFPTARPTAPFVLPNPSR
ncbi:hypothetical protein ABEF93_005587 [Exophiala dermatitidis]